MEGISVYEATKIDWFFHTVSKTLFNQLKMRPFIEE